MAYASMVSIVVSTANSQDNSPKQRNILKDPSGKEHQLVIKQFNEVSG